MKHTTVHPSICTEFSGLLVSCLQRVVQIWRPESRLIAGYFREPRILPPQWCGVHLHAPTGHVTRTGRQLEPGALSGLSAARIGQLVAPGGSIDVDHPDLYDDGYQLIAASVRQIEPSTRDLASTQAGGARKRGLVVAAMRRGGTGITASGVLRSVLAERLDEPVMGVGVCAERGDFLVARRPVQDDCLGQGPVGLQPGHEDTAGQRPGFQLAEQPAAEPEPADPARLTHMRLISAGSPPWNLTAPQPTGSPCRLATSSSPAGSASSSSSAEMLSAGSKPLVEAPGQLPEVRAHAGSGVAVPRVAYRHDDR